MKILLVLCVLAFTALAQTESEMQIATEADRKAGEAYRSKNHVQFLAQVEILDTTRPNHPRIIYNLAKAYALNGRSDDAMAALTRLADMGLSFDAATDRDLASLSGNDKMVSLIARFEANGKTPVNASTRVFELADKSLIAESVAFNPKDGSYFLGSVHQRKIVRVGKNGTVSDFSKPGDGLWSALGIKVDVRRQVLWVATTAFPQMKGFAASDKGRSGIFRYDLRTGKLAKKYLLPAGEDHALGDVLVATDGRVFATDSVGGGIYTIAPTTDEIVVFLKSPLFASLQGLTFGYDEKTLFVADYSKGIFRIDIPSKRIAQLIAAADITVLGIDGLYHYRNRLIAIQNGVNPNRVIDLDLEGDRIVAHKILETNHADFLEPTLGTVLGHDLIYVANSQWPLVNEKGDLAWDKLRSPVILKLNLKRP